MSKWADFVVSGIKKGPGLANISHIQVHEDFGSEFGKPEIIDKKTLASHMEKNTLPRKMKLIGSLMKL